MPNLTREVFDATASTYDKDRSRLIPGCDTFYKWTIDLVPAGAQRICDLGAGSGLLSLLLRKQFPAAHITLVDFSPNMLELAKKRFTDDEQMEFLQADYVKDDLPENFDAIVSSLSIHHLDNEDKRALYQRVYKLLAPGGVFINADQIAGPTSALDARYQALWLTQVRALGATEQQVTDSLYRQREDRRAPVAPQLQWLREAGFADADCWYKESSFAVMAGTRHE